MKHYSVLLKETIDILNIKNEGIYVDCTLGRAGHTKEILHLLGLNGKVIAFDQDDEAIRKVKETLNDKRLLLIQDNFINLKSNLFINGFEKVDGIFYDLGVSSPQLDEKNRGFSYRFDSELDMRMDQINNNLTAKIIVNTFSEIEIANILFKYGDEKFSRSIAKNIVLSRFENEIVTTFQLVEIIKKSLPQKILKQKKHPAKKTFQALRIFVNNELESFEESLKQAIDVLNKNGILAIITFHSLEEKIVKNFFKKLIEPKDKLLKKLPTIKEEKKDYTIITKKPIVASEDELIKNNRSHSAKLWAIRKEV